MNTTQLYKQATTPKAKQEEKQADEAKKLEERLFNEGLETQEFEHWLKSKETQALLNSLEKQKQERFSLGMLHANQGDEETASQLLINANTIERIINYVRTKTPIY